MYYMQYILGSGLQGQAAAAVDLNGANGHCRWSWRVLIASNNTGLGVQNRVPQAQWPQAGSSQADLSRMQRRMEQRGGLGSLSIGLTGND